MKSRWMTLWVLPCLVAATLEGAQEPATPVFRVTASQVVFEFIAVDGTGHVVSDLKKGELEVSVDGHKQKLDFLVPPREGAGLGYVTVHEVAQGEAPEKKGGTPAKSGESAQSAADARSAIPLQTAIVLDSRVLDASNFSRSIDAIRRFINQSLQGENWVMLAEIDRGLKVVTPLTRDREALLRGVASLQPATVYNPLDRSQLKKGLGSSYFDDLQRQVVDLRVGLSLMCRVLSASPGRKHIVFFSEGYPLNPNQELEVLSRQSVGLQGASARQSASRVVGSRKDPGVLSMVHDIVSVANTFGVKFYTVDARGLEAVPGIGEANVSGDFAAGATASGTRSVSTETGATEIQVADLQLTQINNLDDAQNTLLALASGTNGSAFFNSNDLGVVLRASTSEDPLTYLASFRPNLKGKAKFRRLQVKCKRKGVIVRSQTGFTDFTADQVLSLQLAAAFEHPEFFQNLQPILDVQTTQGQAEVVMGLDGARVAARPQADQFHLAFAFAGRVYDESGKPVSEKFEIQKGFALDLTREQFLSLGGQPLLDRKTLSLSKGKHRLVLVAVDQVSGRLGATSREFSVP